MTVFYGCFIFLPLIVIAIAKMYTVVSVYREERREKASFNSVVPGTPTTTTYKGGAPPLPTGGGQVYA